MVTPLMEKLREYLGKDLNLLEPNCFEPNCDFLYAFSRTVLHYEKEKKIRIAFKMLLRTIWLHNVQQC